MTSNPATAPVATPHPDPYGAASDPQVRWWHLAFYAGMAITVGITLTSTHGRSPQQVVIELAGLAVIVLAYALAGARAVRTRERSWGIAYLVVLIIAIGVIVAQAPQLIALPFIGFTQCWMMLDKRRDSLVACAALAVSMTVGFGAASGWDADEVRRWAPLMAVVFLFAAGLGLWVGQSEKMSAENARLLDELRTAQAELAAQQHAAGVVAERERVAREIHDTLAQGFMSVVTLSQVTARALRRGDVESATERVALMESTARDNLAEARALVAAFAPTPLHDGSLADALGRLVDQARAETGLDAIMSVDPALPALASSDEIVLYRAAQEALTNVRRHAGASAVTVTVTRLPLPGGVRLTVSDNGTGIAPDTAEGFGLTGMRDRVTAVGGTLAAGPGDDGCGTTITVTLPPRSPRA